ncbi:MAG: hypothetical protein ACYC2H_06600 [Thermoplasmatota archaeon]
MHKNKTGLIMGVALVLLVAFVVVPSAQAQTNANLAANGIPTTTPSVIRPGSEAANVKIPFKYSTASNPQNLVGGVSPTVTVTATQKQCSPYIIIVGSTSTNVQLNPSGAATPAAVPGEIAFQVTLKPDAPGLETLECKFDLQAAAVNDQALTASNILPTGITVQGQYVPLIQANVANGKLKSAGPQKEVPYQLELTNFGNAKTVVSFAITNEPSSGKWEALAPEQVTLNSEQSGLGNKQTIPFIVSTTYKNGWNNAVGGYTLELTPVAFIDPEAKGTPSTVNVLARVRGVYVPGIEPFAMLAALVGSALVLRMQQRDE